MPAPTNPSVLVNNYLGGYPGGYDNHVNDWRVDYDLSAKQRISSVGAMGTVGYVNNYGAPFLPPPYIGGDLADIYPKDYVIGDTYTFSPNRGQPVEVLVYQVLPEHPRRHAGRNGMGAGGLWNYQSSRRAGWAGVPRRVVCNHGGLWHRAAQPGRQRQLDLHSAHDAE